MVKAELIGTGDPGPIRAAGKSPGILALHGYGGTPREVELFASVARELELSASAPLLPGHGTCATDLARTRWVDWSRAASAAYDELGPGARIVGGLSLGSLLAIQLAAAHPDTVRGLILVANATWLAPPTSWALAVMSLLPEALDFSLPKLTSDIADPAARRSHLTYGAQPVRAAVDVYRGGKLCRKLLERVRCPTLILHGARDRVCPSTNAARVAALLGPNATRVVTFPRSRHILTRDIDRAAVRRELSSFVKSLL